MAARGISFYYCQIAPYDYGIITEPGKNVINSAYLREQQAMVEHRVGNSGMAVLLDAGMKTGIHPGKRRWQENVWRVWHW